MAATATTSHLQLVIALAVQLLLLPETRVLISAQDQQPPPPLVVRPGCRDRCGNITIPYPFGIGSGCFRDGGTRPGFALDCDDSRAPPRLTVAGYGHRLAALSLAAGEARVYLPATRECYNSSKGGVVVDAGGGGGGRSSNGASYMALVDSAYLFSPARNRLVALGCPNLGYFVDAHGYYVSGCMSVCRPSRYAMPGPCTGVGCCQSAIPPAVDFYEPHLLTFPKGDGGGDPIFSVNTTTCRYVFLVETSWWFRYSGGELLNRTDDFAVPVVLDWAIRNVASCSVAARRSNGADYACRSTASDCVDTNNGAGYRCSCSQGYAGNPYLAGGCTDIDECQSKDRFPCYGVCTNTLGSHSCECPPGTNGDATAKNGCRPKDTFTLGLKVVTGVSVGVFLPVFMCFWLYIGIQKRKLIRTKQKFFEQNGGFILQQQMRSYNGGGGGGFTIFSKEELEKATANFAPGRVLGRGGHGIVYKGILDDASVVAIKKSRMTEDTQISSKEFAREMLILSQINHRNVVKLLGCCLEVELPMLVYEFVSNGTLHHYIHGGTGTDHLINDDDAAFSTYLRIALESAEALSYMHSSASPPIVHGDVKTANILLDENLTAKVSDFGASKLAAPTDAAAATLVQGTCGYLDPEYLMTCRLTDKSDVYSFGVVLLELLTRKTALRVDGPEEERSLVLRFMAAVNAGRHEELVDRRVRDGMRTGAVAAEMARLVVQCLSMSGAARPAMKEVAERLEMVRRQQDRRHWDESEVEQSLEQKGVKYRVIQDLILDLEGSSTRSFSL